MPFSEMSRVSEYPIEGIKLIIDGDFPASMRAERITPLPVPPERDLSAVALRFELAAPERADALWPRIVERLADVGIDDALGIVAGNDVRTILHVALGTVVEGDPRVPPGLAEDERKAAAKEAGLIAEGQPHVTFHDLRHAFASIMIERGLTSAVLAHVMGHRDATTTERKYVHLFNRQRTDDQVREAMQSAMAL